IILIEVCGLSSGLSPHIVRYCGYGCPGEGCHPDVPSYDQAAAACGSAVASAAGIGRPRGVQGNFVSGLPPPFLPRDQQGSLVLLLGPFVVPGRCADCRLSLQPVAASLAKACVNGPPGMM